MPSRKSSRIAARREGRTQSRQPIVQDQLNNDDQPQQTLGEKKWIKELKNVPAKTYYHWAQTVFGHTIQIKEIIKSAKDGTLSVGDLMVIAHLLKGGSIKPYGDRTSGLGYDLKKIDEAIVLATDYEENNPGEQVINHVDIHNFVDQKWFKLKLSTSMTRTQKKREEADDWAEMLEAWDPLKEEEEESDDGENDDEQEESEKEEEMEETDNIDSLFREQEGDYVQVDVDEEMVQETLDPEIFTNSEYVVSAKTDEYTKSFEKQLKRILIRRTEMIKELAALHNNNYPKAMWKPALMAFCHKTFQCLMTFMVFHKIPPNPEYFVNLLSMKVGDPALILLVKTTWIDRFKVLTKKGYINDEGARVKPFDRYAVNPNNKFKVHQLKVVQHKSMGVYDEETGFRPFNLEKITGKKRKRSSFFGIFDDPPKIKRKKVNQRKDLTNDSDPFIITNSNQEDNDTNHGSSVMPIWAKEMHDKFIDKLGIIGSGLAVVNSKMDQQELRAKSPKSLKKYTESDKRGLSTFSRQYAVHKKYDGFHLIALEQQEVRSNVEGDDIMRNLMNAASTNKKKVQFVQDKESDDDEDNSITKRTKSSETPLSVKRDQVIIKMIVFMWRAMREPITNLMLEMVTSSTKLSYLVRSSHSTSIKKIFTDKDSVFLFISEIQSILNHMAMQISHYKEEIAEKLREMYIKKSIVVPGYSTPSALAEAEITGFIAMIHIAQDDWTKTTEYLTKTATNDLNSAYHFYSYLNKAAKKAESDKISILSALMDQSLVQRLFDERGQEVEENWMKSLFPTYNHASILKLETLERNHSSASQGGGGKKVRSQENRVKRVKEAKNTNRGWFGKWLNDTKIKLKGKYTITPNYCGHHHHKGGCTKPTVNNQCDMRGAKKSHLCLCGSDQHTIDECTDIFK